MLHYSAPSSPFVFALSAPVGSTNVLDAGYKKLKLVKRGHMALSDPLVCGVLFEALPAWKWSFQASNWTAILLTDTDK